MVDGHQVAPVEGHAPGSGPLPVAGAVRLGAGRFTGIIDLGVLLVRPPFEVADVLPKPVFEQNGATLRTVYPQSEACVVPLDDLGVNGDGGYFKSNSSLMNRRNSGPKLFFLPSGWPPHVEELPVRLWFRSIIRD